MSRTVSPSVDQPYGLARVLFTWKIPRSGFYARRGRVRQPDPAASGRRGRASAPPRCACVGSCVRTACRRRHVQARAHGPKAHDRRITPQRPDEMWGTDMTTTATPAEGHAAGFVAVDHATAECVGIHAAKSGDRCEALEPTCLRRARRGRQVRQGVRERFGAYTAQIAAGLSARYGHGSAYLSDVFQSERRFLGATSSPAFVREPKGTCLPAGRTAVPNGSSAP